MASEDEPPERYTVMHGNEVCGQFDTADEVRAFVWKRKDRRYEIYDRRKPVSLKDLKD